MQSLTIFCAAGRNERGAVLVATLVVLVLLMGVAALGNYSGYTNLLTSTNLRLAARARATAEANINEALCRLATAEGKVGALVLDRNDPDWQVEIRYTTGDTSAGDGVVSTLQNTEDWPAVYDPAIAAVTLQYKKDEAGKVIFYNRHVPAPNPPFISLSLPPPLGTVVSSVYGLLCDLGIGGVVEICPGTVDLPDAGNPVVQLRATGFDERGARRDFVADVVRTIAFVPPAPLSSGIDVNLNGSGFLDGVNHHHDILIGAEGIYGDDSTETTDATNLSDLLGLLGIKDSPDDNNIWVSLNPVTVIEHAVANVSLTLLIDLPLYTSYPRLFNRQLSATNQTPAWVGVSRLTERLSSLPAAGFLLPDGSRVTNLLHLGIWTGRNEGYASAIALSADPTVIREQSPNGGVWTRGVFTWRGNNKNDAGYGGSSSVAASIPAQDTITNCSPPNGRPALVCRPAVLAEFPTFQEFLGLDDAAFQNLLDDPDVTRSDLDSDTPPEGFTYIEGNFTLTGSVQSPSTNDFTVVYVTGDLTINGNFAFKGLIFVDGDLKINGDPTVLGAIMVRGITSLRDTVGTGNMRLLYSREAVYKALSNLPTWRILSWADTAVQE